MTALAVDEIDFDAPIPCYECTKKARRRDGKSLPKTFPDTLNPEHIANTFDLHPWLRGTRMAAMIEALYDAEVMGV